MSEEIPGGAAITLQVLQDKSPEWVDRYLRQFEEGKPAPHSMIGLEALAMSRARSEQSLEWAGIAVRAAALHALEGGGEQRAATLWKAMALRAWFISKMGSQAGHPVLDKATILRWFRQENEFSFEDTKELSARWRRTRAATPSKDELIKLRNIKGRISVLRMLADAGELPDDPELKQWLELRGQIP